MEFKNYNPDQEYVAFLYKRENGQTIARKFYGEEATQEAVDSGEWFLSPSAFVDEACADLPEPHREQVKLASDTMSQDVNILANADKIDDIEKLKTIYQAVAGKPMHKRVKSIKGARAACKKLLGDLDGDSAGVH